METSHPLDAALRERLKADTPSTLAEFGKAIGRSPSWLHKYMNGAGHATIDDVIRILALLIGVETRVLTADESKLLKAFRAFDQEDDRQDVLGYAEHKAKLVARRAKSKESSAPAEHTPPVTVHKGRGTRKAEKG